MSLLFIHGLQCFMLISAFIFVACAQQGKPGATHPKLVKAPCKGNIKEGIQGTVLWFEGNFMPGPGVVAPSGKPVKRMLGVFEPTQLEEAVSEDGLFTKVGKPILHTFETDENGCFRFALKPGKYSLMSWEDGKWFANYFDEGMTIMPVQVMPGKVTELEFKINYRAYY